jgi:hypothetical protein
VKTYTAGPCDTCGYAAGPSKTPGLAEHGQRMHSCAKNLDKAAKRQRGLDRDAAVDRTPKPCTHTQANHVHGTHACYVLDRCRCRPCARANADYEKHRARRHAYGRFDTYTDAQPVREHVQRLMEAGVGLKRIATLAGVSQSALGKLIYGTTTRPASVKTTQPVATRILAVRLTLDTYAPGARVPNVGTKRRLQALMAIGWSQTALANSIGMEVRNFNHLLHGKRAVTAKNARAVKDLYDELWNTTPDAPTRWHAGAITRSLRYARTHGWPPPMAWDDDTLDDPQATPDTGDTGSRGATVENVEWLLTEIDPVATVDQVAHRLGISVSGVQWALTRDGRRDLLDQLLRNADLAGKPTNRRVA